MIGRNAMSRFRLHRSGTPRWSRSAGSWGVGRFLVMFLAGVFWGMPQVWAQGATAKTEQAEAYYQRAQEARQALEQTPAEERTPQQYLEAIRAFRRVYLTAPAYGNNTVALMAIAELYREMGRRGSAPLTTRRQQEKYFQSAIQALEFLVREYPRSRYRLDARLAIARIYRDDLQQPEEALERLKRYAEEYPRSAQAKEARESMAAIQTELAARKKELEEAPAAPGNEEPPETSPKADVSPSPDIPPKAGSALAQVTNVRHWMTADSTRVVIELERKVRYEAGRVANPARIYIDLYDTRPAAAISGKTVAVENGLLKSVKAGRHRVDVTRVVLTVADRSDYSLSELPNPYRLVVDLQNRPTETPVVSESKPAASGRREEGRPAAPASAGASPKVAAGANPEPPPSTEPAEVAKAAAGPVFEKINVAKPNRRDGTRSLTRALGLKIGRILLDPGHGGHDTGTIGPAGLTEKDLVLDVAQRLGQLIAERLGSEGLYTRQDDTFVPLEARTVLANEKQADLFLSIHANSGRSASARGIETYYLNFTTDPAALEVAARENAVSQERISQLQGLVRKIALQEKVDESKEFAAHIQGALWKSLSSRNRRSSNRGVKKAPFVVLVGANMPSVLAEIAFLSNPADEKLLNTAPYRQKIAAALYAGLVSYAETLSSVKVVARSQTDGTPPAK